MPLESGGSKEAFSRNVATEMSAGKPQKQAVAIAYSKQRSNVATEGKSPMDDLNTKLDACVAKMDALSKRMDAAGNNHPRADVEGYMEGGEFHPIRNSKGYKRTYAGEPRRKRRRR